MGNKHVAAKGSVYVGDNKVSNITGYDYEGSATTIDDRTFDDDVESESVEVLGGGGSVQCLYDKSDTTAQGALVEGQRVTLNIYPIDRVTGERYLGGNVLIKSVKTSGQQGGMVQKDVTFTGRLAEAAMP